MMLEPQLGMSVEEIVDWARYAENSGYGYLLRSDHLLPTIGKRDLDSPECWVTLGAIAAATATLKFGPLVSPIGFRNPALLARMACSLHSFAHGRLVLGVGAGWYEAEYASHGFEFPRFDVRIEQLHEGLEIIRPLTEGKEVEFKGKYYSAHTSCLPKPHGKINLIIGGKNRKVIELAATYADEWNIHNATLEELGELKKFLDHKRGSKNVAISRMGGFIIGENESQLERRVGALSKLLGRQVSLDQLRQRGAMVGSVEEFVTQMKAFIEAGIDKFYFQILDTKDKEMAELLTETLKTRIGGSVW